MPKRLTERDWTLFARPILTFVNSTPYVGASGHEFPPRVGDGLGFAAPRARELPVGVRGELCIAGHGVALGYHRQPQILATTLLSC